MITAEDYYSLKMVISNEPYHGELTDRLQYLQDEGYIEPCDYALQGFDGFYQFCATAYQATIKGRNVVSEFEDHHNQAAKKEAKEAERQSSEDAKVAENQKKVFRHDYAVAAFGAVSGALVTLVFEYICGHAGLFVEFFRFLLGWT